MEEEKGRAGNWHSGLGLAYLFLSLNLLRGFKHVAIPPFLPSFRNDYEKHEKGTKIF